jgi:hypothetical protein
VPLGIASQECWARSAREEDQKEKARRKYLTHIKDKKSYKWIVTFEKTITDIPKNTRGVLPLVIEKQVSLIFYGKLKNILEF